MEFSCARPSHWDIFRLIGMLMVKTPTTQPLRETNMSSEATRPDDRREELLGTSRSGRPVVLGGARKARGVWASSEAMARAHAEAHEVSIKTVGRHRQELLDSM